ncbi:hypothetical protein ILYODFUR_032578 [Ilyodon furcidens]|uniref:Uncharacterized protein n=1 Tax=Ilyodon furcidens TaxID=33524 RepID=A0ABV0UZC8_9TELE
MFLILIDLGHNLTTQISFEHRLNCFELRVWFCKKILRFCECSLKTGFCVQSLDKRRADFEKCVLAIEKNCKVPDLSLDSPSHGSHKAAVALFLILPYMLA